MWRMQLALCADYYSAPTQTLCLPFLDTFQSVRCHLQSCSVQRVCAQFRWVAYCAIRSNNYATILPPLSFPSPSFPFPPLPTLPHLPFLFLSLPSFSLPLLSPSLPLHSPFLPLLSPSLPLLSPSLSPLSVPCPSLPLPHSTPLSVPCPHLPLPHSTPPPSNQSWW